MRKASMIILCVYFAIFFFAGFIGNSEEGNSVNDYARIIAVDYVAEVDNDGTINVTERLTFDIHAASEDNLFWELWRDLPESYVDGLKVDYEVNSVKQILDDGSEIYYKESPKLYWDDSDYTSPYYGPGKWFHSEGPYDEEEEQYECVMLYVDGLYREQVTFEIEYEMNNAALRYNDCSELYLSFYSEDTIKYLESFKGEILVPDEYMPSAGNYEAHTFGTNSNSFPFTESDSKNWGYHTFSIELDEEDLKFKPYNEYIEFTLVSFGEDKHSFTEYAPDNDYSDENVLEELREEQKKYDSAPERAKKTKTVVFVACVIISILVIKGALTIDKKMKKKYNFYTPSMKIQYFRDIPSNMDPHFIGNFTFCKHKAQKDSANGYSAILLSLIRKDYIEIEKCNLAKDWTSDNVKIIIKHYPIPQTEPTQTVLEQQSNPVSSTPVTEPTSSQDVVSIPQNSVQDDISTTQPVEHKKLEPLTLTENYYFNLIFRYAENNEITMRQFQSRVSSDYENTNTFVTNIEKSTSSIGTLYGYFQKADYEEPKKSLKAKSTFQLILGLIILIIFNLISYQTRLEFAFGAFCILGISFIWSSRHIKKLARHYVLLTQLGEDEYEKWRGLYNFLNSETLMKERTVVELPLWEQYLVYATAFGISKKVIAALKIRCPDMTTSPMLNNSYIYSHNFHYSSRTFRSATRTASYTVRSGGHGGYGGGGRGGGGGGGGH